MNKPNEQTGNVCLGILAPVDAGKTTLAESLFYVTGKIKKPGRVDHQDSFFDTGEMERSRGITIFSKQALLETGGRRITLLDTPGHVDFSAETERTLSVLDAALLLISASDGVVGHARTLWKLLQSYHIPVFVFVNKMDRPGISKEALIRDLKMLDEGILPFDQPVDSPALQEEIALCSEALMEQFLEGEPVTEEQIRGQIEKRRLFPCFFGSALKIEGIDSLLEGLARYLPVKTYPDAFGARVYKITRQGGVRLTHMKITGGCLKVKQLLETGGEEGEKAEQIRLYDGTGYTALQSAAAGSVAAVTGLEHTFAGQGLGAEGQVRMPMLTPVLSYEMSFDGETDIRKLAGPLKALEEEIPEMHLVWHEGGNSVTAAVMGEVQIEILSKLVEERTGKKPVFGEGRIIYRETVSRRTEGVGHFEPLRHYAEVHLLLEPAERGSGITLENHVPPDTLAPNWQHLIMSHLEERVHPGVLTGSELTDVRISLVSGRAHLKHTEGGDFRQAVYRALRQGLMKAECVLLEPFFEFRIDLPRENAGRAMADLQALHTEFSLSEGTGETCGITGRGPVATLRNYQRQLTAYTGGEGRMEQRFGGYYPCHNAQEVIAESGYDPDADEHNPSGSVFCSHGAGHFVPWNEVERYMHLPGVLEKETRREASSREQARETAPGASYERAAATDKELEEIFRRTFGDPKEKREQTGKVRKYGRGGSDSQGTAAGGGTGGSARPKKQPKRDEWLLVDGYNIIYDWDDLRRISEENMDAARIRLLDMLVNYQGYHQIGVIVVFDAYKVAGGQGESFRYQTIDVVYTREAETADTYIERSARDMTGKHQVTVATSDAAEQMIIWGEGARRMSARELQEEIRATALEIQKDWLLKHPGGKTYLFDHVAENLAAFLEDVRLGRKSFESV